MASSVAAAGVTGETTSPATTPTKQRLFSSGSSSSVTAEEAQTATAPRPKQLFATLEMAASSVKPQLAQHSPTATTTATSAAHRFASPSSPSGSSSQSATSPSFLPDMPQWKKDLIQRRKTNVARTIGAASSTAGGCNNANNNHNNRLTPTSSCSSLATAGSAGGGGVGTTTNYSPRTSFSSPALAAMTNADHHQQQPDAWHTQTKEINSTLHTARTKVTTTTTTRTASRDASNASEDKDKDDVEYKTYEQMLNENEQQQQQENPEATSAQIHAKMPAHIASTTTTTAILGSPTKTLPSAAAATATATLATLKSPTKEKSEMKFLSGGGHYTPQGMEAAADDDNDGKAKELKMISGAATATTTTTATAATANVPIPKQRSTICSPTKTTKNSVDDDVDKAEKQQEQQQQDEEEHKQEHAKESTLATAERRTSAYNTQATTTTTALATRLTGYEKQQQQQSQSQSNREPQHMQSSESNYKRMPSTTTTTTTALATTALMQTNTLTANQLHSKYDNERSVASVVNASNTASAIQNISANTIITTTTNKISTKLQNNTFIKNQQQSLNISPKYYKYKAHAQDNQTTTSANSSNTTTTTTGSTSSLNSNSSNSSQIAAASKKKMVAVQEMKTTATTDSTNMNSQTKLKSSNTTGKKSNDLVDVSEDLSYGPGIVSRLRCRYLSLALRESMEKERLNGDNMRRATSLSNLLERDDHDEEDGVDEDGEDDSEQHGNGDAVELRGGNEVSKMRASYLSKQQLSSSSSSSTTGAAAAENGEHKLNASALAKFEQSTNVNGGASQVSSTGFKTPTRLVNSQVINGTAAIGGSAESPRSRQFKRGNDSIKRARSVEALLCERPHWQFVGQRSSYNPPATSSNRNSGGGTAAVTIEDKIQNARERLLSGTDTTPPKRLTSIIDDTERPPPDLVKQTLRLFEASANRRRGGPQRQNSKGDVATKVANYKSIINEQKPAVVYPKQQSPTKKPNALLKPVAKPVLAASDLINSPIGRKTTAASLEELQPTNASTPKPTQQLRSTFLSADTPDIIPRHNIVRQLTEKSEQQSQSNGSGGGGGAVDSPVTALTKKLEKLSVESPALSAISQSQKQQQQQTIKHNNTSERGAAADTNVTATATTTTTKLVGGDALAEPKPDRTNGGAPAIAADTTATTTTTTTLEPHQAAFNNDSMQQAGSSGCSSSDLSDDEYGGSNVAQAAHKTKRITRTALENIAKAGTTQQFTFHTKNGGQSETTTTTANLVNSSSSEIPSGTQLSSATAAGKQIGVIRPLQQQQQDSNEDDDEEPGNYIPPAAPIITTTTTKSQAAPQLTTREIEKNRINEMKKTNAFGGGIGIAGLHTTALSKSDSNNSISSTSSSSITTTATSSLDTVINTNASGGGQSELDAAAQITVGSTNSPLWALRKKRQPPAAAAENTSMKFNFTNRKEVPDYIESDGVIIRRKFELPKANESGFVLLHPDLTVETSTDNDYDEYSMCPPSPCDVEFENANIVIDGKSSIRNKPKDATFRVQFNDTLTSTFEYPSEMSLIVEDSFNDYYANPADELDRAFQKLITADSASPARQQQHHHVAVDEIIQLPTIQNDADEETSSTNTPKKNILGNLPLGSAPLGLYTPLKAPLENMFQLGVTRAPQTNGHAPTTTTPTNGEPMTNGNGVKQNGNGYATDADEHAAELDSESLQYLKPANDDLNLVYSEGTQKTDLLY